MSVSPELIAALTVNEKAELLLELDAETGISFFLWAQKNHPEMIDTKPAWDCVRRYILKYGEIPPGVVARDVTEPTKEEGN